MPCSGRRFPLRRWTIKTYTPTALSQVVDLVTGVTPPGEPALYGGAIPLFRPGDLDRPSPLRGARDTVTELGARHGRLLPPGSVLVSCIGLLGKVEHLPSELATRYEAYALRANDVVFGLDRPVISTGIRAAKLTAADLPALLVQRVARLVPRDAKTPIDSDYLLLCLQSDAMREHLLRHATGTQLPHISATTIESMMIPLPPLETQRTIAQQVAAAGQHVITVTAHHTAAQQQLDELWLALLGRAFSPQPQRDTWTP